MLCNLLKFIAQILGWAQLSFLGSRYARWHNPYKKGRSRLHSNVTDGSTWSSPCCLLGQPVGCSLGAEEFAVILSISWYVVMGISTALSATRYPNPHLPSLPPPSHALRTVRTTVPLHTNSIRWHILNSNEQITSQRMRPLIRLCTILVTMCGRMLPTLALPITISPTQVLTYEHCSLDPPCCR
jgi:hypothetical protein